MGAGTVTISITKVPDTGNATSTRVRTCMVSIPNRQAFACRTFAFAKDWSGGAAAVSPAATAAPGAL